MPLQEWIHTLEEGKGALWIKRIFILLTIAAVAVFYDLREFKNFSNPEAMDAAQVGRQIAEGKGFTTRFIRPLSLKLIMNHQGEQVLTKGNPHHPLEQPHPDLANAPVYPLMLAGLMKALPFQFNIPAGAAFWRYQPEVLIAIFNQILFALLLGSVYFAARQLFDPGVAAVTVAVTALTEIFWRYSVSGLPTIFLTLITVWIIWGLSAMEKRAREQTGTTGWFAVMSILIGAFLAIGALTRYSYGWMILPVAIFATAAFGPRRGIALPAIILVFAIAVAPWCYRNYSISGRILGVADFAAIEGTTFFPKNRFQRSMPQNLTGDLNRVSLDQLGRKLAEGVGDVVRNELPRLGGSWVTALFLVGLLAPFRNVGLSRLRYFLLGSLALLIVVQSLGRTHLTDASPEINSENLLILLAPFVFMFGIALFYSFMDQMAFAFPPLRVAAVSGFVLVVSLPLLITFLPPRSFPLAYPPYYPPYVRDISGWMGQDELVMSDMPWAVAWYGDRTCVWTTLDTGFTTPSDFFAIHDHIKPIKLLYLTPVTMDVKFVSEMLKGSESAWSRFALDGLVRTNVPPGFPLKHSPRGYLPDFLILTDRKRW